MATILSSKTILVPKHKVVCHICDDVADWLHSVKRGDQDCRLVIRLEAIGKATKKDAVGLLSELIEQYKISRFNDVDSKYEFDFAEKSYFWKDKDIYLTANEQLFLYRWLMLNDEAQIQYFYLRNMRRRLGKEFLADMTEGKNDNS